MKYTVVSFATKDIPYINYGRNFEKNMKSLGIPYDIEYINPINPSKPNKRLLNKSRKKKDVGRTRAKFLLRKLKQYNSTIIWMDCDDGLINKPKDFGKDFDVGFIRNETNSKDRLPITAGVFVLNPTENTFHFLKVWDYLNSWDELEPVGGSHVRLCYARDICFGNKTKNITNFKEKDLSDYFLPYWRLNLNKK